jgi:oligopeptidase A
MDDVSNPLLKVVFDVPFDRIRPEHVEPAVRHHLAAAEAAVASVADVSAPTYANTLEALDDALEPLEWAMGLASHLESVDTSPELRAAYNAVEPDVTAFYSRLPLHGGLWRVMQAFADTAEAKALTGARRRHLDKTLRDFRRHGADLDAEGKRRLTEIDVELGRSCTRFSENVLDATAAFELLIDDGERLAGLPERAVEAARESAAAKGKEGYRLTLQMPSLIPSLTYLDDRALRETLWRAHNTRATAGAQDNRPLVRRILELRREKARLLGYADFADLILEERMAKRGGQARDFVDMLRGRTQPFFEAEIRALDAFRQEALGEDAEPLAPWDVAYWVEKRRKALFDLDDEALRPYFPMEGVLGGLFETVHRLYGVRVERLDDRARWHPDVRVYALRDGDGAELGVFYADLHPRETKRDGAWMGGVRTGFPGAGMPHVGVICANLTPPSGGRPALLTHDEVQTVFHEFGHLLHHLLSTVEVRSLAGCNAAWDFIELPSQIMENWCWEREALDLFARHYETGAPIPDDLFEKMNRARTYWEANGMMRQLGFASLDLALHLDFDPDGDTDPIALAKEVFGRHAPTPLPGDWAMVASFGHLFGDSVGYAAGYYSYKWAEVLDADAFTRFKSEGVFSRTVGEAFREKILARGDSAPADDLFRDFMGRAPRVEALLERSGLVEA